MAAAGALPEHYGWQVEHQLMVSGAALAHVYVFDGREGILIEQRPERERWATIEDGWEGFMRLIAEDLPPPLTDRDSVIRTDREWEAAAKAYLQFKEGAEEADARLDEAKAQLVGLASHTSEKGAGVCVSRFWKVGAINYKKRARVGWRGPREVSRCCA